MTQMTQITEKRPPYGYLSFFSCLGLVKLVFANAFSTDDLLSHSLISSASGAPVRVIVIINLQILHSNIYYLNFSQISEGLTFVVKITSTIPMFFFLCISISIDQQLWDVLLFLPRERQIVVLKSSLFFHLAWTMSFYPYLRWRALYTIS